MTDFRQKKEMNKMEKTSAQARLQKLKDNLQEKNRRIGDVYYKLFNKLPKNIAQESPSTSGQTIKKPIDNCKCENISKSKKAQKNEIKKIKKKLSSPSNSVFGSAPILEPSTSPSRKSVTNQKSIDKKKISFVIVPKKIKRKPEMKVNEMKNKILYKQSEVTNESTKKNLFKRKSSENAINLKFLKPLSPEIRRDSENYKIHEGVSSSSKYRKCDSHINVKSERGPPPKISKDHQNVDDCMEWEEVDKTLLRNTRNEIDASTDLVELNINIAHSNVNKNKKKTIYCVVDTNVLIQALCTIKNLANMDNVRGFCMIIMVPWQVLKELDKLKTVKDDLISMRARRASNFLSDTLKDDLSNIIFQKQAEHFEECPQVTVEVPDDHLIKCCYQIINDNQNVILLSNDINLCVKAKAASGIHSVGSKWLIDLLESDSGDYSTGLHSFENEPKNSDPKCSKYLYKLTQTLHNFLYEIISDNYKQIYSELWVLWLPKLKMNLRETFSCLLNNLNNSVKPYKPQIEVIKKIYQDTNSYQSIVAADIDRLGKHCILLARSLQTLLPDIANTFDTNMAFLKTGIFDEQNYTYTSASVLLAQSAFRNMEEKLNSYLNHVNELGPKIISKEIDIPDTGKLIETINLHITITNDTSSIFLLLDLDELSNDSQEIAIFHKTLLKFLEVKTDKYSLPLLTADDILSYISENRLQLLPAALHWLSSMRHQFIEYKFIIRSL